MRRPTGPSNASGPSAASRHSRRAARRTVYYSPGRGHRCRRARSGGRPLARFPPGAREPRPCTRRRLDPHRRIRPTDVAQQGAEHQLGHARGLPRGVVERRRGPGPKGHPSGLASGTGAPCGHLPRARPRSCARGGAERPDPPDRGREVAAGASRAPEDAQSHDLTRPGCGALHRDPGVVPVGGAHRGEHGPLPPSICTGIRPNACWSSRERATSGYLAVRRNRERRRRSSCLRPVCMACCAPEPEA